MKKIFASVFSLGLASLLSACGAGDEDSASSATTTGVFHDSPVSGLWYQGSTGQGYTTSTGSFPYKPGVTYSFYVGKLLLGSFTPGIDNATVTPAALVPAGTANRETVIVNLTRFLLTLDSDQDASDGIQIKSTVDAAAVAWPAIDFASGLDSDTSSSKPQLILTGNGNSSYASIQKLYSDSRTYVSASDARNHLQDSMRCAHSGAYFVSRSVSGSTENLALVMAGDGSVQALKYTPAPTPAVSVAFSAAAGSFSYASLLSADGQEKNLVNGSDTLTYKFLLADPDRVYVKAVSDFTALSRIGGVPSSAYRVAGLLTVPRAAGDNHYAYVLDITNSTVTGRILDIHSGSGADVSGSLSSGALAASATVSGRSVQIDATFASGSLSSGSFKETDSGNLQTVSFAQPGCQLR